MQKNIKNNSKNTIAVVFGGVSSENEISIITEIGRAHV